MFPNPTQANIAAFENPVEPYELREIDRRQFVRIGSKPGIVSYHNDVYVFGVNDLKNNGKLSTSHALLFHCNSLTSERLISEWNTIRYEKYVRCRWQSIEVPAPNESRRDSSLILLKPQIPILFHDSNAFNVEPIKTPEIRLFTYIGGTYGEHSQLTHLYDANIRYLLAAYTSNGHDDWIFHVKTEQESIFKLYESHTNEGCQHRTDQHHGHDQHTTQA
jgi:hypothetical protein